MLHKYRFFLISICKIKGLTLDLFSLIFPKENDRAKYYPLIQIYQQQFCVKDSYSTNSLYASNSVLFLLTEHYTTRSPFSPRLLILSSSVVKILKFPSTFQPQG